MRHQNKIYVQNNADIVRNRSINNFNMSSDIYVFENPLFNISGASKIDCLTYSGKTYITNDELILPISFNFTGNTSSFSGSQATFKFKVFKYDFDISGFTSPPIYESLKLNYSSDTSTIYSDLPLDLLKEGEFLIKGFYDFTSNTEFMQRLDKKIDNSEIIIGNEYGLYNKNEDFFIRIIGSAQTPTFLNNGSNTPTSSGINQQIILPSNGSNIFTIANTIIGNPIITFNGLVLAKDLDYTLSGNIVTLFSTTLSDDIITAIYTTDVGNNLNSETIIVTDPIISGSVNTQGSNRYFYNTTSSNYEVFTEITPMSEVILMLNGVTLLNGVDFYRSITNTKRLILEGDILEGDILTLVYFPITNTSNAIINKNPLVTWSIKTPPSLNNGYFTLELSKDNSFDNIIQSGVSEYVIGQNLYSSYIDLSSARYDSIYYYRVKNTKNYTTMCNTVIKIENYSEVIPITIKTNSFNSY